MLDEYDLVAKIRLRWGVSFAMMIIVVIDVVIIVIQREKMTTKLRTEVAKSTGNDTVRCYCIEILEMRGVGFPPNDDRSVAVRQSTHWNEVCILLPPSSVKVSTMIQNDMIPLLKSLYKHYHLIFYIKFYYV